MRLIKWSAIALLLILFGAYTKYRFTSCISWARGISGLALHGHFSAQSCSPWNSMDTHIVLTMDSATAEAVDREAGRSPKYRRLEDLPAFDRGGHPNGLAGKRGWYSAVQYSNNGGHTVVIDLSARTLTVDASPM
jgi:hypothetical protein